MFTMCELGDVCEKNTSKKRQLLPLPTRLKLEGHKEQRIFNRSGEKKTISLFYNGVNLCFIIFLYLIFSSTIHFCTSNRAWPRPNLISTNTAVLQGSGMLWSVCRHLEVTQRSSRLDIAATHFQPLPFQLMRVSDAFRKVRCTMSNSISVW